MIFIERKEGESFERFLNRFKRALQGSKVLTQAVQNRNFQKKKSRNVRRKNAIERSYIREQKEKLVKQGIVNPEQQKKILKGGSLQKKN